MQLHPGQNGKYWQVSDGGIACDSEKPAHGFYLELREPTKVCIKTEGGNYLVEKRNGGFNVGGTDEAEATRLIFSLLLFSSPLSQNLRPKQLFPNLHCAQVGMVIPFGQAADDRCSPNPRLQSIYIIAAFLITALSLV